MREGAKVAITEFRVRKKRNELLGEQSIQIPQRKARTTWWCNRDGRNVKQDVENTQRNQIAGKSASTKSSKSCSVV